MRDEDGINSFPAKLVLQTLTACTVTMYSTESYTVSYKEKYMLKIEKSTVDLAYVEFSPPGGHY